MVAIVKQLCIKSYEIAINDEESFKVQQGKEYTTTVPDDTRDNVTLFSTYWFPVPKEHFVKVEKDE